MATTVRDIRNEIRLLVQAGDFHAALAACNRWLEARPDDGDGRRRIAALLERIGDRAGAAAIYRATALHDIAAGHALPAILGVKALDRLGAPAGDVVERLAATYAAGAPTLDKLAPPPGPADLDAPVAGDEPGDGAGAAEPPAARARARALDFSGCAAGPSELRPLPLLSELPREAFAPVIRALAVRTPADGELVVRQGDPGVALYFVAAGEVHVLGPDARGREVERARLHESALFGEMALLTEQPRTASVRAAGDAELLELGRDGLTALEAEIPALQGALDRFARERLLRHLLATSLLFRPFTAQQQMELVRRFEGHEVTAGTEVIRDGDVGLGLYVVLSGEVVVTKRPPDGGTEVVVARLHAGETFGEMSLVHNQPTSASVRAERPATLLFLAREYFQRLVQALPALRRHFEELSQRRDVELRLAVARPDGAADDLDVDIDVEVDVLL
jgi:CRP-like cAMP-binding protein